MQASTRKKKNKTKPEKAVSMDLWFIDLATSSNFRFHSAQGWHPVDRKKKNTIKVMVIYTS